jgi:hypothetical protein
MKFCITLLMSLTSAAFIMGAATESAAFHNGGVGPCEGCHTMHNSFQGAAINNKSTPQTYLLREADSSSTCLYCHEHQNDVGPTTYHISTPGAELLPGMPPKQLTPGGDFGWLKKTYTWYDSAGDPTLHSSPGDRHGHNIVASDFSYFADATNTSAPGGNYPANKFSCISCHDPHGKYRRNMDGSITTTGKPTVDSGSFVSSPDPTSTTAVGAYRLLGGKSYQPRSLAGPYQFVNDPPAAVAPDSPNRAEDVTQTRVAYGSGMSEWCQNCHPTMHMLGGDLGPTNLQHASGSAAKFFQPYQDNYNKYIADGNVLSTPDPSSSYLSLVPFEEGTSDYAVLKTHAKTDDSYLYGPDASSQVTCLSCHRAHASGWDGITRWNAVTSLIISNGTVSTGSYAQEGLAYQPYGQGRTEMEALRAYYGKPETKFAPIQDTLCNKCHIGVYP